MGNSCFKANTSRCRLVACIRIIILVLNYVLIIQRFVVIFKSSKVNPCIYLIHQSLYNFILDARWYN